MNQAFVTFNKISMKYISIVEEKYRLSTATYCSSPLRVVLSTVQFCFHMSPSDPGSR